MTLPARSDGLPATNIISFDVDCGELIPGHRFIARGLVDEGRSTHDLTSADQTQHQELQMVSLAYELVPGVPAADAAEGAAATFIVEATYATDVALPWTTGGSGFGPGSIDEYAGGASTGGASGPWPLPDNAVHLQFTLYAAGPLTPDRPSGTLEVDLATRSARWTPANHPPEA
jgi:hypothetical protein